MQDKRPIIKRGGGRCFSEKPAQGSDNRFEGCIPRQGARHHRPRLTQMTMKHEPAFDRVHGAIDPFDRMRQPIVEDHETIESRLNHLIEPAAGCRPRQVASERIVLTQHQGLAAYGAPIVFRQRIHVSKAAVAGIIVPSLTAAANIEAEIWPGDPAHAQNSKRPTAQCLYEALDAITMDDLLGTGPQIGVKLWNKPVVPDLVGVRAVRARRREMRLNVPPHRLSKFDRQESVAH